MNLASENAPDLANEFTIAGRVSKRTVARVVAEAMSKLGIAQYAVVGQPVALP